MVLNAFAVNGCGSLADSQSQQELIHDFMSTLRKLSKAAAFLGKAHRSIGLCVDVAILLRSGPGTIHRNVADSKSFGRNTNLALPQTIVSLCKGLNIVLRQLRRVDAPSSLVAFRSGL